MPPTKRAPRSMRYVFAPSKGTTTLGAAYSKGTPIIEIKSMAGVGQTHYILPSEIEALVKTEPQPYRSGAEIAASLAKAKATRDTRAHIYGLEKCIMEELIKIPIWHDVNLYKQFSKDGKISLFVQLRLKSIPSRYASFNISSDKIVIDYRFRLLIADPNVFVKLAIAVTKLLNGEELKPVGEEVES